MQPRLAGPGGDPIFRCVRRSCPVFAFLLFLFALEARRRGDERLAGFVLERVVRLDPQAVLPRLEWAEVLLSLGEPDLVEALLMPVAERSRTMSCVSMYG